MFSRNQLRELVEWKARPGQPVLSLYLDVDQSRAVNLNRGFERTLKSLLRSLGQDLEGSRTAAAFMANAQQATASLATYRPQGQSLCLFSEATEKFLWRREIQAPIPSALYWDDLPHVRPLLDLLEEYERYSVILADRAHARLFTVFLAEIEEHEEVFASSEVQSTVTTGTDRLWSQKDFQRKAEVHSYRFLKGVAEAMERRAILHGFDHLILAGPVEATTALHRLLSKRLRSRVVRSISLPIEAKPREVLEATLPICQEIDRAAQEEDVEELVTAASKGDRAVGGMTSVLPILQQGRVWRLLYAEGLAAPGWRCGECSMLFAEAVPACPYCGGNPCPIRDLMEEVAQEVLKTDGKVEPVHGNAASRLGALGGIGAHLRF